MHKIDGTRGFSGGTRGFSPTAFGHWESDLKLSQHIRHMLAHATNPLVFSVLKRQTSLWSIWTEYGLFMENMDSTSLCENIDCRRHRHFSDSARQWKYIFMSLGERRQGGGGRIETRGLKQVQPVKQGGSGHSH